MAWDSMVTEVRFEQSEKAELPIVVTDSGMVILIRFVQSENAFSPMLVIPSPKI